MHSSDLAGHPLYRVTSSQLCTSIYEGASSFDLLVCSLQEHGPETEHLCVGDDGSVLAQWSGNSSRVTPVEARVFPTPRAS